MIEKREVPVHQPQQREAQKTGHLDRAVRAAAEMRGAWAGELGQTQFMPSSWIKYAVDFDGNGKRDLIRSVPDVLASTANYLRGYGWQRDGRFDEGSDAVRHLLEYERTG